MTPATQNAETDIQGEGPGNQEETRERGRDEGTGKRRGNRGGMRERRREEGMGGGGEEGGVNCM